MNRKVVKKPPSMELPEGIWANILHKLGVVEILETTEKVCSKWRRLCKNPSTWRVIDMWNLRDLSEMDYDLEVMCRHAVDRSQGEAVDINLQYFATAQLLEYIAERLMQLFLRGSACCWSKYLS
ncbi:F-box family protein isoform X2 [Solanum lycopersicum]|uniref:F-box domain-containing protein n=1 Tax=Solanum lycopersicum TaxID=4081 RepID=A0A3Q7IFG7_SOLLC|nr:F-box family protein isoform X2 [Solanum lycopersicum]